MTANWRWLVAFACAGMVSIGTLIDQSRGYAAMPNTPAQPLQWEGAADRVPSRFLAVRVSAVVKDGGGLFGLGNSPSIVGALPDPRIITGTPIGATDGPIRVHAPAGELPPSLAVGARLVLGLVEPRAVICLLAPPDSISDDSLVAWAAGQRCG